MRLDPLTGLITGVIAEGAFTQGPLYVSTVTYTDAAGNSGSTSFAWFIADPVTLQNPGDQSGTEGEEVWQSLDATDANTGATFTWTQTGLPNGLNLDPDSGTITGTPDAGDAGVYVVTVTATDDGGAAANQTFVWSIDPAVTISGAGRQSVTEGQTALPSYSAADATGGAPTFSATGLPPGLNISSGGQITGVVNPGDAANGPYVATITATDGTYTATKDVVWNVAPAVTVSNPGPRSNSEGDAVTLQLSATDSNSTGGTLIFSAKDLPPDLTISDDGLISGTVAAGAAGFYNVTVTASDGTYSGVTTILWSVANSAVSMADPGPQNNTEGDAVSLPITTTDATGLPRQYSESGLPPGLSINSSGQIVGTIRAGAAGVYVAVVTASDADFASASQTFLWTVAPAVTLSALAPQSDTEGEAVSEDVTATDSTGATPTFSQSGLPPGLGIDANGDVTGTVNPDAAPGLYTATIKATDGTYSASEKVRWDVAPAVTISALAPQSDTDGEDVSEDITATDSTGATPTFSESGLPPGLDIDANGDIAGTVSPDAAPGLYTATIKATDGTYTASEKVRWDVVAPPDGTWTGNMDALDAFWAQLGRKDRTALNNLLQYPDLEKATLDDLIHPRQGNDASPVPVDFGHPGIALAPNKVLTAAPPAQPAPAPSKMISAAEKALTNLVPDGISAGISALGKALASVSRLPQAFVLFSPTHDPNNVLTFTTLSGPFQPQTGDWGGFAWFVRWNIDKNHPSAKVGGGVIVQHVRVHFAVTKGVQPADWDYWEAWPVAAGTTTVLSVNTIEERLNALPPGQLALVKDYLIQRRGMDPAAVEALLAKKLPWDDQFGLLPNPGSSGVVTFTAVAYYFPNLSATALEGYGFKLKGGVDHAGGLLSVQSNDKAAKIPAMFRDNVLAGWIDHVARSIWGWKDDRYQSVTDLLPKMSFPKPPLPGTGGPVITQEGLQFLYKQAIRKWELNHYTASELLLHALAATLAEYLPRPYRDMLFPPPVPQTDDNNETVLFVGDPLAPRIFDQGPEIVKFLNENLNWLVLDPHVWDLGWVKVVIKGYNGFVPLPYSKQ